MHLWVHMAIHIAIYRYYKICRSREVAHYSPKSTWQKEDIIFCVKTVSPFCPAFFFRAMPPESTRETGAKWERQRVNTVLTQNIT